MPVQDVPSSALVIGQSDVTCVEADSNTNPRKDHPGFVPDIPRPKRTSGRTGPGGARQTPCRKHMFRRLLVGHPSRLHSPAPLRLSLTRSNFYGGFVMPSPKAHAAVMQRTEKRRRLGNDQGGLCLRRGKWLVCAIRRWQCVKESPANGSKIRRPDWKLRVDSSGTSETCKHWNCGSAPAVRTRMGSSEALQEKPPSARRLGVLRRLHRQSPRARRFWSPRREGQHACQHGRYGKGFT